MNKNIKITMACIAACWLPATAIAADAQIEGAKLCTRNLSRYEREYGIPMHLLSAISATESGRYHKGLKLAIPWPWTINVGGEGQYFESKAEAVAAVKKLQARGVKNIDVGCMQVSQLHHPDAFASLEDAFDPEKNVQYGASFLRSLYEESKSWKQASAAYHSRTPERGNEYVDRVYDRWTNIINRLRAAKAAVPESTVAALSEKDVTPAASISLSSSDAPKQKVINVQPTTHPSTTRMNSIVVSDVSGTRTRARDNGVLVIRPKITVVDDATNVASAAPIITQPANQADMARVIHVADTQTAQPKAGPKFIFEN